MKTPTANIPTMAAILPASMLSCPSSGPTVRSSRKVISAGKAPARKSTARLVDSSSVKLPVMIPDPPVMADWMVGAEMTLLSSTMAKGRPMFAPVYSPNFRAPVTSKLKLTAGRLFWSKEGWALVNSSPVTTGTSSST